MPKRLLRNPCSNLAIAMPLLLLGCLNPVAYPVTYTRALEISREVANDHGYVLSEFKLDTFGDSGAIQGKWTIYYNCEPVVSPGCGFMVVVDRQTGKAELHQAE